MKHLYLLALCCVTPFLITAQDFVKDSLPSPPSRYGNFAVADFDDDTFDDIIGYKQFFNAPAQIAFRRNTNDRFNTFEETVLDLGIAPIGDPGLLDVDGDGDPDVAVVTDANQLVFLINDAGTFTVDSTANIPGAELIRAGDVDGDGDTDFLNLNTDLNTLSLFTNGGDGAWSAETLVDNERGMEFFFLTDIDNDGDLDPLVIFNEGADRIVAFLNDGMGNYTRTVSPFRTAFPDFAEIGDFNGDGLPDIYYLRAFQSRMDLFINNGGLDFTAIPEIATASPRAILPGDFNGDGLEDFAVGTNGSGIRWYENRGAAIPTVTEREVGFISPAFELAAIDLDNDGDLDILGSNLEFHYFVNEIPQLINSVFEQPVVLPLSVFPNPTTGDLTLQDIPDGTFQVRVTDFMGRAVLSGAFTNQRIQLGGFPAGRYVVSLADEAGRVLRSAVVEKR